MTKGGELSGPEAVWETEPRYTMCMVSPFSDAFSDAQIHLADTHISNGMHLISTVEITPIAGRGIKITLLKNGSIPMLFNCPDKWPQ